MSCLQSTDDGSGHDTSAFPFDLDDEGETPSGAAEAEMWAEELLNDSALLVVSPDVFDYVQEPRWRGWPPSSRC